MEYIKKSIVDAIIFDNNYTLEDIKADFEYYPEGWNCVLKNEMSIDTMTDNKINEFKDELFKYVKYNF